MSDPWATIRLGGRTFRVDPCGFYEELIEVPLDSLVMSEGGQYPERAQRYVKMHRAGSQFPPIAVAGVTPDCPRYRITNGHHRFLRQAQDRFLRQAHRHACHESTATSTRGGTRGGRTDPVCAAGGCRYHPGLDLFPRTIRGRESADVLPPGPHE